MPQWRRVNKAQESRYNSVQESQDHREPHLAPPTWMPPHLPSPLRVIMYNSYLGAEQILSTYYVDIKEERCWLVAKIATDFRLNRSDYRRQSVAITRG